MLSAARQRIFVTTTGRMCRLSSLRIMPTAPWVSQQKPSKAPFSSSAPVSGLALRWQWEPALTGEGEPEFGSMLTPKARRALALADSLNLEERYGAWCDVMRSMLRDEVQVYSVDNCHAGVSDAAGVYLDAFACVRKVSLDGTGPVQLLIRSADDGPKERLPLECTAAEWQAIERIADYERAKMQGPKVMAFLFFQGRRFYWGLQRAGQPPYRMSDDVDASMPNGEMALIWLRRYLASTPGRKRRVLPAEFSRYSQEDHDGQTNRSRPHGEWSWVFRSSGLSAT
ncbi:uncharacterized protein LOC129594131 [Paramacrobiotus metropolitanus]|uniref:uncharacterized protein LOC129594131 n=1 Tax=Paramacrobiotus metropolitanus TaxID=2943436 RepID=UPI00244607EF|nr:uncharacterized protein LOC129594131 [Paramacrobiotus metropolitanus]XP_055346686.1 uncharacterized protein LOC129594131 [Paramacrobiotus metropolitanus]XP_055346687.1 uncharacterized protein LOC129594131 [Paramacrobiotus metropolitanus]